MSDAELRADERLARAGDVEARRRWRAGLMRIRDPRVDPRPGDVVRADDCRLPRLVRHVGERGEFVRWARVTWLYGPDHGAGMCYQMRLFTCEIGHWRKWAKRAEVVRVAEERQHETGESA